jgi:hypothetical protein
MVSHPYRDQQIRSVSWKFTKPSRHPLFFRFTRIQRKRRAERAALIKKQWQSCWRTHSERLRPDWDSECFLRWLQKRGATSSFCDKAAQKVSRSKDAPSSIVLPIVGPVNVVSCIVTSVSDPCRVPQVSRSATSFPQGDRNDLPVEVVRSCRPAPPARRINS